MADKLLCCFVIHTRSIRLSLTRLRLSPSSRPRSKGGTGIIHNLGFMRIQKLRSPKTQIAIYNGFDADYGD
jgi:hypothetical protein